MAADPSPIALRLLGQDHALEPGRVYLLGSSGDSDFVLGEAAAPRHARLAVDADGVVVEDLGAAEGTWCNGERIARRRLQVGDVLRLGPLEAVVVPDHGVAALVPIPALRAAASARRLQAIGARAAAAMRRRSAATFQDLMAEELRRAPWLASSFVLHALFFVLLWLLVPEQPVGAAPHASATIAFVEPAPPGEPTPAPPEVRVEPPAPAVDATLPEESEPAQEIAAALARIRPGLESLRTNPQIAKPTTAGPSGPRSSAADGVAGVGSGGFQRTVAQLQKTGLEIVFVFDSTGSMTRTITDTKATIAQMLAVLRALVPDARVGIVTYRDRGSRENYLVRELPLGHDFWRASNFVQFVAAEGGGDRPEDVRAGLRASFEQRWRPNARRVVVLAGDAPPHDDDWGALLAEVRVFARNGRSFVHTLVTSPGSAGQDTQERFAAIAAAGKGTCTDLQTHERVLQRVLTLAFGREFDQDLAAVIAAVGAAAERTDVKSLDLARQGGPDLLRELRREPVPAALLSALTRRPRRPVALELVDVLGADGVPDHTRQAVAWVLQRVLELPVPPIDPMSSDRPSDRELERLRRRCVELPD